MMHIVDSTVSTPAWHATANIIAIITAVALMTVGAISIAILADSVAAAALAASAGIAAVVATLEAAPRSMAFVNAR